MFSLAPASAQDFRIANIVELTGTGEFVGVNWRNGVELAATEINDKGGVLGQKIELTHHDNQSNPGIARSIMQRVVEAGNVYAVFGPVFSGHVKVTMTLAQQAEIPQFIGGEASELTRAGNPYLFRTALAQGAAVPKLANYLRDRLKAKSAALVTSSNEFGKSRRDAYLRALSLNGIALVSDLAIETGQPGFQPELDQLKASEAEVVLVVLGEEDAARFLRAARESNLSAPVIGEQSLIGPRIVELAGGAAEGVRGHIGLAPEAPLPLVQAFRSRYERKYGATPDANAIKGYLGVYALKHATEKVGKFDRREVARVLRGLTISPAVEPGILAETTWDETGDLDRVSFLAEVRGGKPELVEILPKIGR